MRNISMMANPYTTIAKAPVNHHGFSRTKKYTYPDEKMTFLDPFVAGFLLVARCLASSRGGLSAGLFLIALTTDARSFAGVPFDSAFCCMTLFAAIFQAPLLHDDDLKEGPGVPDPSGPPGATALPRFHIDAAFGSEARTHRRDKIANGTAGQHVSE